MSRCTLLPACRPAAPSRRLAVAAACLAIWAGFTDGVAAQEATASRPLIVGESWDIVKMQGAKVGYSHTKIEEITADGRRLLKITNDNRMKIRRFGQTTELRIELVSVESPSGQLVRCQSTMRVGPIPVVTTAEPKGDKLVLTTKTLGKQQTSELAWRPTYRGFFGPEHSLLRRPMKPGETRRLKALIPAFNQVAEVTLEALDYEQTAIGDKQRRLLKVKSSLQLGGSTLESFSWVNDSGETIKTFMAAQQQETLRVTKAEATGKAAPSSFDLGQFSIVKLDKPLAAAHSSQKVVYRIELKLGDPEKLFANSTGQELKSLGNGAARLTVIAARPGKDSQNLLAKQSYEPDDLRPNNMIQSDDKRIVAMADKVAPGETDAWKLARALERKVHTAITAKNFSQTFATAAEVAKSLEGDCTEHSVLLAALCRARKIPARVAVGLVYFPKVQGFAYHMWTEVWIRDRWIPLDATLGRGGIGAAHIKLTDSNLKGASPYSAFLPVIKVLGQLKLKVESAE